MEKRTTKWDGQVLALAGKEIKVGDTAPDATLVARDLTAKKLSDWDGQIKVLLPVPSMDTPVCQSQVRQFNKDAVDFADDVVVIALSTDLPFAQERFCAAEGLDRVVTLSDHKMAEFGEKYGYLVPDLRLLSRGNRRSRQCRTLYRIRAGSQRSGRLRERAGSIEKTVIRGPQKIKSRALRCGFLLH